MRWLIFAGIALSFAMAAGQVETDRKQLTKENYYREHPLTPAQIAANQHFVLCWQYRNTPHSVWPDHARETMLAFEGCYSDDRDDPRISAAAYPWNESAPHP